jgi:hypothetical protein
MSAAPSACVKTAAVKADPGQIQQIVMNLVINRAEASGERDGCVTVHTGAIDIALSDLRGMQSAEARPGRYVYLEVRDNGLGMDEAAREKIFDPFFTTKFQGRSLGLSAVMGIVRRHDGPLRLESVPGEGAVFTVLLPALVEQAEALDPIPAPRILKGSGTVLVVDDEPILRNTAKACLERYGYQVMLANDGREAVELYRQNAHRIQLALLDLAMLVMNGTEALKQIHALQPDLPAILTSG